MGLGRHVRVEAEQDVEGRSRSGRRARPAGDPGQLRQLVGALDRDPAKRRAVGRRPDGRPQVRGVLPIPSSVIRSFGMPAARAAAHSPDETTFASRPAAPSRATIAGTSLALTL